MDCTLDIEATGPVDNRDDDRRRLEAVLDTVIQAGLAAKSVAGLNAVLRAVTLRAKLAGLLDRPARRGQRAAKERSLIEPQPQPAPIELLEPAVCGAPDTAPDMAPDTASDMESDTASDTALDTGPAPLSAVDIDPPETIVPAGGAPAPVLVYRGVLRGAERKAAAVRRRFAAHGWGSGGRVGDLADRLGPSPDAFRDVPEALALLRGRALLGLGSEEAVDLGAGDLCVLPAGTDRQCLEATGDLAVVTSHPDAAGPPPCDPLGRPWPGG